MRHVLRLALRYLLYHRVRTIVLVLCIALVFFLPVAVTLLVNHFEDVLVRRAREVPLVIGAKGSRYDLVLAALYFRGRMPDRVTMAELATVGSDDLATAVPVLVEDTARGLPVVGTTLDYFDRMGLRIERGTLPLVLGDAVVGADVADALDVGPGGRLLTDTRKLYDISAGYPLLLHVRGVLARCHTPDDGAVFVDVKTAWVALGIGHGHQDVARQVNEAAVLERRDDQVVVDSSVKQYMEITPDNVDAFHFHGDPATFPLTAVLVWPRDTRARTLLKGRYAVADGAQMLVPTEVVDELLGFVFRMKRFFDANVVLVGVATALFLGLIVVLQLRIRQRERETLFKIGCSRGTLLAIWCAELGVVLVAGLFLAGALAALTLWIIVESHAVL